MKKILIKSLFILVSALSTNSAYAQLCESKVTIKSITAGYVEGYQGGPDGGSAFVVQFSNNHSLPLNRIYNSNDVNGRSLISVIRMAFSLRSPISIIDNYGSRCDDFDEIVVFRD